MSAEGLLLARMVFMLLSTYACAIYVCMCFGWISKYSTNLSTHVDDYDVLFK